MTMRRMPNDTLAALQASRQAMERQLKEDTRVTAARVIQRYGEKNEWPEGDIAEVLGALGLIEK